MNGFHWLAHYPREHLIEVGLKLHWTWEGPYWRIVDAIWMGNGKLVDNDSQLAQTIRCSDAEWTVLREKLSPFFEIKGGYWRHAHVTAELKKANRLHEARSVGAQSANAKRYAKPALAEQSPLAERSVRALSRQTDREEDTDVRFAHSDADASPVFSPLRSEKTSPQAAKVDFWKRADSLVGDRGLVGRMAREFGRKKVNHALDAIERTKPDEPASYLVACCQDRLNGADEPDHPTWKFEPPKEPPPASLYPEEP